MVSKDKYTIEWHFSHDTIMTTHDSEQERDSIFDYICKAISQGDRYFAEEDLIINAGKVLYIKKGNSKWQEIREPELKN